MGHAGRHDGANSPGLALASEVTFTTNMRDYGGDGAYLAYYVTDAQGKYVGSLWMAGGKARYYEHLSGWYRATGGDTARNQRHYRCQRRCRPLAQDHARPCRYAVRCRLPAAHRRRRRRHARQPQRDRRAADHGRLRPAGHGQPLHRRLHLRALITKETCHDPVAPPLVRADCRCACHRPRAERHGPVGLPGLRGAHHACGPGHQRRRTRRTHPGGGTLGGADPARAVRPDHRLLFRG